MPADNPNCDEEKSVQEDPLCWTSIWDSVWESASEVLGHGDENSRRAVILLSDGDDTSSTIKRQDAIDAAVKNNVAVYSIGIGDPELYKVEQDSLRKISDSTGGRAFFPRDETELGKVFAQIQEELRSQYVIAYSPMNKLHDGSHRRIRMEICESGAAQTEAAADLPSGLLRAETVTPTLASCRLARFAVYLQEKCLTRPTNRRMVE